jgi:hypothetical protein
MKQWSSPIDGEEDAHLGHSRCNQKPSPTLLNHPEQVTLPSQQHTIETFCAAERQTALES